METIGKYKVHLLASKLPLMTKEEYEELKESIRTQGLLHPVIVSDIDQFEIIDGRNRTMACDELGITPRVVTLYEYLNESAERRELTWMTDELTGLRKAESTGEYNAIIESFIILQNINRRQLTDWQKYKTLTAVKGKPKQGTNQHTKRASADSALPVTEIAESLNMSERKVKQLNVIDAEAPEEVKEKLAAGKISTDKAYKETKQRDINVKLQDRYDKFEASTTNLERWIKAYEGVDFMESHIAMMKLVIFLIRDHNGYIAMEEGRRDKNEIYLMSEKNKQKYLPKDNDELETMLESIRQDVSRHLKI